MIAGRVALPELKPGMLLQDPYRGLYLVVKYPGGNLDALSLDGAWLIHGKGVDPETLRQDLMWRNFRAFTQEEIGNGIQIFVDPALYASAEEASHDATS